MNEISPAIRVLARRLVELEAGQDEAASEAHGAGRAFEKLREPLAQLMGLGGYYSLMSRAIAIARPEQASLAAVRVLPDGTLEGLENSGQVQEGAVVIMSQLLGLLIVFIGEPLALGLVRETWPEVRMEPGEGNEGDVHER
jgi:hypothetical protein